MGNKERDAIWRHSIKRICIGFVVGAMVLEILVSLIMVPMDLIRISLLSYAIYYVFLPALVYWFTFFMGFYVPEFKDKKKIRHYDNYTCNLYSLLTMLMLFGEVAWVHYVYETTLALLVIPILFSYVYADKKITYMITAFEIASVLICTIHSSIVLDKTGQSDPFMVGNGIIIIVLSLTLGKLVAALDEKQKNVLEELEATVKENEIANEAKTAFLANMSHEIRTPINAIIGLNEMIRRENLNDQINDYSNDINNAADSLLNTVNSILDLTKIESGKMELTYADYDILSLIHDVVSVVNIRAIKKGLEIKVDVDKDIPSRYNGDDVHIKQIITNLLTNAVKYTDEGSILVKVFGHREGDEEVLEILVKDTGIGIRFEDKPKLFSKFERIDLARNRNVEGTGLGLTITAQLLRMMNSGLEVDSEYGKGSTFFFKLRQKIVSDVPVGEANTQKNYGEKPEKYKPTFVASKANILVVDDNAMNLKVFGYLLKSTKMNVDKAESGKVAIEKSRQKKYDIIFMDHMMPEMDGIETMHAIKADSENINKDTKVVALTANAIVGAKEMYLSEGFDAFLSKPIEAQNLEKLVLSFLPKEYIEN